MHELTRYIPKALAVFALGPFAVGVWWLTWVVTSEAVERSKTWKPCVATLVQSPDDKRFLECELEGKKVRVEAPDSKPFRSMDVGGAMDVMMNPANPAELINGGTAEMWASTGMLSLLGLFLTGSMVFLWRVNPGAAVASVPAMTRPRGVPEMEAPRSSGRLIELRQPPMAWKANLFWAALFGFLALWCIDGIVDGSWVAGFFLVVFAGAIWWLVRESQYNKSFVLRSQGSQVWIESCRGGTRISADDVLRVEEVNPEVYRFLDGKGKALLTLSPEMGSSEDVMEVVRRLNSVRASG